MRKIVEEVDAGGRTGINSICPNRNNLLSHGSLIKYILNISEYVVIFEMNITMNPAAISSLVNSYRGMCGLTYYHSHYRIYTKRKITEGFFFF